MWVYFFAFFALLVAVIPVSAGWGQCVGRHFGFIAPSKGALKEKFTKPDEFVKGALASGSSMMEHIKKDPDGIRQVAKEIGYAEPEQKPDRSAGTQ